MTLAALRSRARNLLNDNTSPFLYDDTQLDEAINQAYFEYLALRSRLDSSPYEKTVHADSVKDQEAYQLPSDFITMRVVAIEYEGKNLLDDTDADPTFLEKTNYNVVEELLDVDDRNRFYWALMGDHLFVTPPPSKAGTKSIEITYEFEPTELVNDSDEPAFSDRHHAIIAVRACVLLREAMMLDSDIFKREEIDMRRSFVRALRRRDRGTTPQFRSQALGVGPKRKSQMGRSS